MDSIVKHQHRVSLQKTTLRQCLVALGVTDAEMRYRKNARGIMISWTGEERELLDLVKRKWKRLAALHHEANGGDGEQWKQINQAYTKASNSIRYFLRRIHNPRTQKKVLIKECAVCGEMFDITVRDDGRFRRKTCSEECRHTYRVRLRRKRRHIAAAIKHVYKICQHCGRQFETNRPQKKYCRTKCREYAKYQRLISMPDFVRKKQLNYRNWYNKTKNTCQTTTK